MHQLPTPPGAESVHCAHPAASIPVVGFNAVLTSEHFGAFFTFAVLHAALAIRYIKVCTQPTPSLPSQNRGGHVCLHVGRHAHASGADTLCALGQVNLSGQR